MVVGGDGVIKRVIVGRFAGHVADPARFAPFLLKESESAG